MTECPTRDRLVRLLDSPYEPELAETESHVGVCPKCQDTLVDLSVGNDWWSRTQAILSEQSLAVNAAAIHSLRGIPLQSSAGSRPSIPGYDLTVVLGRGGMGTVYAATQVRLGRPVAVKVLREGRFAEPVARRRFLAEASTAAKLQHPHIVAVHDTGEIEGFAYFVMERVDGGSLADALKSRRFTIDESVALVETIADAVQHAHEQGVIHRDLKPGNILLAPIGPKVADFGLAVDPTATQVTGTGELLGTPQYMAPEQASGRRAEIGPATDVFALGAILYELLTGQSPFAAATAVDTLVRVNFQDPIPPRRLNRSVPKSLETVCLKCLEKLPRRRYTSARDLAGDLARFRAGKPVLARPMSAFGKLRNWSTRNPSVAGLLAALVTVVVCGVTGISVALVEARDAQRSESAERKSADAARDETKLALAKSQRSVYYGAIAQARSQWLLNNANGTSRLLSGCDTDARGWEWRYLNALSHADLRTISEPDVFYINAIVYDSAGRRLLVGGGNPFSNTERGRVWMVDADTGRTLWKASTPETVWALALDPKGGTLATIGGNPRFPAPNELRLWDVASGNPTGVLAGETASPGTQVAFAPDGSLACTVPRRFVVVRGKDRRETFRVEHQGDVFGVCFTADGHHLVTSGTDGVRVWDATRGTALRHFPQMGMQHAIDPGGTRIASVSGSAVKVWEAGDFAKPDREPVLLHSHPLAVTGTLGLMFAPDGQSLAAALPDGTVRVWSVSDGTERVIYRGHTGRATSVAYRPDTRVIVSAAQQPGEIKFWDCTSTPESEVAIRYELDRRDVDAIAFTADGRLRAVGKNGWLREWDGNHGAARLDKYIPLGEDWLVPATPVAFSADGRRVAGYSAQDPAILRLADAETGRTIRDFAGHTVRVWLVAMDQTGSRLASCGFGTKNGRPTRERIIWDVATGQIRHRETTSDERPRSLAWSPDGSRLAEAVRKLTGPGGRMMLFDPAAPESTIPCGPTTAGPVCLSFTFDSRNLAVLDDSGSLSTWDAVDGTARLAPVPAEPGVAEIRFDPTGTRIAGASRERVFLWDAATGHELLDLPAGPPRFADNGFNPQLAWSPDGNRLAVSTWNRTVCVFGTVGRSDPTTRAAEWHRDRALDYDRPETRSAVAFHRARLDEIAPTDPGVSVLRGNYYAFRGEWLKARTEYAKSFATGFPTRPDVWPQYAAMLLKTGDNATYRRLRSESFRKAAEIENPMVCLEYLRTALLDPEVGDDLALMRQLVDRLHAEVPDEFHPYGWVALGFLRTGQRERAKAYVAKKRKVNNDFAIVNGLILLKAGDPVAAAPLIARAEKWLENERIHLKPDQGAGGAAWNLQMCLTVERLLREARSQ